MDWAYAVRQGQRCGVTLQVSHTRAFQDRQPSSSQASGFFVHRFQEEDLGVLLTNRHSATLGPAVVYASFEEHEQVLCEVLYSDPVHDFAFYTFPLSALRRSLEMNHVGNKTTSATSSSPELSGSGSGPLVLNSAGLQVGVEVRIVGNDDEEGTQILSGTVARINRNPPCLGDYDQDFHTFYALAASSSSGGSSGSPVLNNQGECIALNTAAANTGSGSYYLPLQRVTEVLEHLKHLYERETARCSLKGTLNGGGGGLDVGPQQVVNHRREPVVHCTPGRTSSGTAETTTSPSSDDVGRNEEDALLIEVDDSAQWPFAKRRKLLEEQAAGAAPHQTTSMERIRDRLLHLNGSHGGVGAANAPAVHAGGTSDCTPLTNHVNKFHNTCSARIPATAATSRTPLKALLAANAPKRGTINTVFSWVPLEEAVINSGLDQVLDINSPRIPTSTGALVVEDVVPESPAADLLQAGDALLRLDGVDMVQGLSAYFTLEKILDGKLSLVPAGGSTSAFVDAEICRSGMQLTVKLPVTDLFKECVPCSLLEYAMGCFHDVSQAVCLRHHIGKHGVYVAKPGFLFDKLLNESSGVIREVNGVRCENVEQFEVLLSRIPDGERFLVSYITFDSGGTRNEREAMCGPMCRDWQQPVVWVRAGRTGGSEWGVRDAARFGGSSPASPLEVLDAGVLGAAKTTKMGRKMAAVGENKALRGAGLAALRGKKTPQSSQASRAKPKAAGIKGRGSKNSSRPKQSARKNAGQSSCARRRRSAAVLSEDSAASESWSDNTGDGDEGDSGCELTGSDFSEDDRDEECEDDEESAERRARQHAADGVVDPEQQEMLINAFNRTLVLVEFKVPSELGLSAAEALCPHRRGLGIVAPPGDIVLCPRTVVPQTLCSVTVQFADTKARVSAAVDFVHPTKNFVLLRLLGSNNSGGGAWNNSAPRVPAAFQSATLSDTDSTAIETCRLVEEYFGLSRSPVSGVCGGEAGPAKTSSAMVSEPRGGNKKASAGATSVELSQRQGVWGSLAGQPPTANQQPPPKMQDLFKESGVLVTLNDHADLKVIRKVEVGPDVVMESGWSHPPRWHTRNTVGAEMQVPGDCLGGIVVSLSHFYAAAGAVQCLQEEEAERRKKKSHPSMKVAMKKSATAAAMKKSPKMKTATAEQGDAIADEDEDEVARAQRGRQTLLQLPDQGASCSYQELLAPTTFLPLICAVLFPFPGEPEEPEDRADLGDDDANENACPSGLGKNGFPESMGVDFYGIQVQHFQRWLSAAHDKPTPLSEDELRSLAPARWGALPLAPCVQPSGGAFSLLSDLASGQPMVAGGTSCRAPALGLAPPSGQHQDASALIPASSVFHPKSRAEREVKGRQASKNSEANTSATSDANKQNLRNPPSPRSLSSNEPSPAESGRATNGSTSPAAGNRLPSLASLGSLNSGLSGATASTTASSVTSPHTHTASMGSPLTALFGTKAAAASALKQSDQHQQAPPDAVSVVDRLRRKAVAALPHATRYCVPVVELECGQYDTSVFETWPEKLKPPSAFVRRLEKNPRSALRVVSSGVPGGPRLGPPGGTNAFSAGTFNGTTLLATPPGSQPARSSLGARASSSAAAALSVSTTRVQAGDLLHKVRNRTVQSLEDLDEALWTTKKKNLEQNGLKIEVYRRGQLQRIHLKPQFWGSDAGDRMAVFHGFVVVPTPMFIPRTSTSAPSAAGCNPGLYVVRTFPGSPAGAAVGHVGDLFLLQVNGYPVNTLEDLKQLTVFSTDYDTNSQSLTLKRLRRCGSTVEPASGDLMGMGNGSKRSNYPRISRVLLRDLDGRQRMAVVRQDELFWPCTHYSVDAEGKPVVTKWQEVSTAH